MEKKLKGLLVTVIVGFVFVVIGLSGLQYNAKQKLVEEKNILEKDIISLKEDIIKLKSELDKAVAEKNMVIEMTKVNPGLPLENDERKNNEDDTPKDEEVNIYGVKADDFNYNPDHPDWVEIDPIFLEMTGMTEEQLNEYFDSEGVPAESRNDPAAYWWLEEE